MRRDPELAAVREDGGWDVEADDGPEPPRSPMLRPSWLLTGYTLETGEAVTADGREALRVVATSAAAAVVAAPRPDVAGWTGWRCSSTLGLGILLRHEEILDGRTLSVTELTGVRIDSDPLGDDAWSPPGGWDSAEDDWPGRAAADRAGRWSSSSRAWPRAGSARWSSRRAFRSFEQATREEARGGDAARSTGPMAADGPPVTDQMLHLLYDSRDRWAPGITATLHEWQDMAAMLARAPDSVRRLGFGGLGYVIDTAGERFATVHTISG